MSAGQRSSRRIGMRLGPVLVVAVLTASLTACGGEEPVRSPLTVEDLGPGDWTGPFADPEELAVTFSGRWRCFLQRNLARRSSASLPERWAVMRGRHAMAIMVGMVANQRS